MNNGRVNKKILTFNFQRNTRYNKMNIHYEIESITYIVRENGSNNE